MQARAVALLFVILICIVAPVFAAEEDRYGYLKVSDIDIQLDNGTAHIHVNYTVDDSTRFIFFLFGKQDLKNKLLKILNYDDAQMKQINLSSAEFIVDQASYSYGDGIYWYPAHNFNVVIPNLTVRSPQVTKNFSMVREFPGGIGYFGPDASPLVQDDSAELPPADNSPK
ncbi:MAG: hypothetical protein ABSG49_07505 [Methanoregula sp.]|jgi:hypothetical protein|uniref:hypothetical protein n=1 Tax=Methanoregula sp. TaxID=2052170 RepID=UPI003C235688